MDDVRSAVTLQAPLSEMIKASFVRTGGCTLLEPLVAQATGPEAFQDRTGYEAFVNKIHIDDLIDVGDMPEDERLRALVRQGVKAAMELSERLGREGKYRVLLSLDTELPTATLRFFERREGEPWGAEDPEAFQHEDVLMIDT